MIIQGDCIEVMRTMEPGSIDAVVTDPPAGVSFMSKAWDHDRGGRTQWVAWMTEVMSGCIRVLKPGGWMLCWSLPRTSHWTAWAIEDAGFKLTDMVLHVFASGFPKGKGQLKPAYEPWILARKPGPLQPLGIDAARIGTDGEARDTYRDRRASTGGMLNVTDQQRPPYEPSVAGRWPANVVLTDPAFDGGWDGVVGGGSSRSSGLYEHGEPGPQHGAASIRLSGGQVYDDIGTYSRFFLIAKSSRRDREPIMPGLGQMSGMSLGPRSDGADMGEAEVSSTPDVRGGGARRGARLNAHPT